MQGYIVFQNAKSMAAAKGYVSDRAHLEKAKGNSKQNYDYCVKDGKFWEKGDRPLTSKEKGDKEMKRWKDAFVACKEGRFDDVDPDIRFRYYQTCKKIRKDNQPAIENLDDVCGEWFVGPPGTGKSHTDRDWET